MRTLRFVALLTLLVPGGLSAQGDPVEVVFLDVGQGDAVLIKAPDGQTALIDAGPGIDLAPVLESLEVRTLDLVVATHPHADHIGGMSQLLSSVPVRFYMDNGQPHTTATYMSVMRTLQSLPEVTYLEAVPRTLQLGSVSIEVLPLPPYATSNLNNHSVGLVVEHGEFRAFLSGDSERPELMHFVQRGVVPDVTLLKAPHHGSDEAVSDLFLSAANPELVVISVGLGNSYGHPVPGAVFQYSQLADMVLRTDQHGEVTVLGFEDGTYEVKLGQGLVAAGQPRPRPPPTSQPPVPRGARTDLTPIALAVFADAPGNDHDNPNGEYAVIQNRSQQTVDLSGWTLCDAAHHCFTFPSGATLRTSGQVVVYTGVGLSDGVSFFMGSYAAVWNNTGDTATLYDSEGRVVVTHVY